MDFKDYASLKWKKDETPYERLLRLNNAKNFMITETAGTLLFETIKNNLNRPENFPINFDNGRFSDDELAWNYDRVYFLFSSEFYRCKQESEKIFFRKEEGEKLKVYWDDYGLEQFLKSFKKVSWFVNKYPSLLNLGNYQIYLRFGRDHPFYLAGLKNLTNDLDELRKRYFYIVERLTYLKNIHDFFIP